MHSVENAEGGVFSEITVWVEQQLEGQLNTEDNSLQKNTTVCFYD